MPLAQSHGSSHQKTPGHAHPERQPEIHVRPTRKDGHRSVSRRWTVRRAGASEERATDQIRMAARSLRSDRHRLQASGSDQRGSMGPDSEGEVDRLGHIRAVKADHISGQNLGVLRRQIALRGQGRDGGIRCGRDPLGIELLELPAQGSGFVGVAFDAFQKRRLCSHRA